MKKEVWISSHIIYDEGLGYLTSCIDSLKFLSDIDIVISYSGLMIELPDNIVSYKHTEQLTQFQHIDYIFNTRKHLLDNNDIILFLDDDDMLLEKSNINYEGYKNITEKIINSSGKIDIKDLGERDIIYTISSPFDEIMSDPNISGLIGLQILGNSLKNEYWTYITKEEIPIFCSENKRELIDDFSGTVIRKQYLEQFLNIIHHNYETSFKKFIDNTVDTKLMDFIIREIPMGNISSNPTVFRRIKSYQSNCL
jgi:hypothetical protein